MPYIFFKCVSVFCNGPFLCCVWPRGFTAQAGAGRSNHSSFGTCSQTLVQLTLPLSFVFQLQVSPLFLPWMGASHLQRCSLYTPNNMPFPCAFEKAVSLVRKRPEADPMPLSSSDSSHRHFPFPLSYITLFLPPSKGLCVLERIWKLIGYSVYKVILQSSNY